VGDQSSKNAQSCLIRADIAAAAPALVDRRAAAIDAAGNLSLRKPSSFRSDVPVPQLYWEDFYPGRLFEHGPRPVSREEIVAFAAEFDPQPMHLDVDAARATMVGGLCASGWHACCILMRMVVDAFAHDAASMGAPGVDEVKWLMPIRPGDALHLRATVVETRASKSRPDMGFVRFTFELFNGAGTRVMTLGTSMMMGRRGTAGEPA
jgi:acyl dehydratase